MRSEQVSPPLGVRSLLQLLLLPSCRAATPARLHRRRSETPLVPALNSYSQIQHMPQPSRRSEWSPNWSLPCCLAQPPAAQSILVNLLPTIDTPWPPCRYIQHMEPYHRVAWCEFYDQASRPWCRWRGGAAEAAARGGSSGRRAAGLKGSAWRGGTDVLGSEQWPHTRHPPPPPPTTPASSPPSVPPTPHPQGMLLPFGTLNAHHNAPNTFLFHPRYGYLLGGGSDPLQVVWGGAGPTAGVAAGLAAASAGQSLLH